MRWKGYEPVFVTVRGRKRDVGGIDPVNNVYQWSGIFQRMTYKDCLMLGREEWEKIRDKVDFLRYIEKGSRNRKVWAIDIATAKRLATMMPGIVGWRVGIPLDAFQKGSGKDFLPTVQAGLF